MPAPATNDELTDVILKSGVIDEAKLRAYVKKIAESEQGLPAEPGKLGGLMVRDGILTYFQAEQLLQGKWKRFFIGKYKVLERLGVGGMGQVFLCEHKLMKRKVAVKVLPMAKSSDEAALSRFYREARAVAAVDHPNLVRAYDIDQDENLHFLVMEFVDGINFHDLVRKFGTVDVLRACHYIFGSVVGLHHAHEMGLVHRDIKPANILIDRTGVVKILDMGLARFFHPDEDDLLTKKFDESVLGTADYLAPEQAIDSSSVDIRADIYGLGGTFYYMLTGFPPFPEGSVAQKLLWHQTKTPKSIRAYRPEVPEGVAAIVEKMMAKDAANRYQSPAELMEALAQWVQTPIPPPPDREMPQMSLAAMGGVPGRAAPGSGPSLNSNVGGNSGYATPAAMTPKSGPIPTVALKAHAPAARAVGATTPLPPLQPAAAYAPPAARVAYEPDPVTAGIPAVWESLQGADTTRNSDGNTAKKPKPLDIRDHAPAPKSSRPNRVSREAPAKNSRSRSPSLPLLLILGGLAFLVVGGAITGLLVWKPLAKKDDAASTLGADTRKVYVTASGTSPDPATTRKTLHEAIATARSGDVIILLDGQYESPALRLEGKSAPLKNIRIESGQSSPVTWTYKADPRSTNQAALEIINVEDVTVDGIVFELNGAAHAGLLASGNCAGCTFQNITVKNPKTMGIRINNVLAESSRPLKIVGSRILGSAPYESGVNIHANPVLSNQFIRVLDSRFEGPGKAAFAIEGASLGIEIRNNRIFGFENGLHVGGTIAADKVLGVKLERNTFHSISANGVRFDGPLDGSHEVSIGRNWFVGVPVLLKAANTTGIKASDNARNPGSKEGSISMGAAVVEEISLSLNKDNDAEFLHPIGGAKLPVVGAGNAGAGAE